MKVIGNSWKLSEVYLLTWNAISKSKTPGHFVLGSCCAVCTSPCFCLCWLDYSQVGGVGDMAVSHMWHGPSIPVNIFISRHRWHPNLYSACRLGIDHGKVSKVQKQKNHGKSILLGTNKSNKALLSWWFSLSPGGFVIVPWRVSTLETGRSHVPSELNFQVDVVRSIDALLLFVTMFYTPEN